MQQSLERKFGKQGGKIPITPSESFEARIAVSGSSVSLNLYHGFYRFILSDMSSGKVQERLSVRSWALFLSKNTDKSVV